MKKKNQPSRAAASAPLSERGAHATTDIERSRNAVVLDVAMDTERNTWLPTVRTRVNAALDQPQAKPARGEYSPYEVTGWDWAPWGIDNRFPTEIREKIESVPIAAQSIYRLAQMMYGNGIAYYRRRDLYNSGTNVKRAFIPDIEEFIQRSYIETKWLPAQYMDYRMYCNTFSELVFSADKRQVVRIWHKQAEHTRLSKQNTNTLRTEYLLYSPLFVNDVPRDEELTKIPLFQVEEEDDFLQRLRGWKFAWHSYFPTPGKIYYARPPWMGLFKKSGWLDVAAAVPEVVNAMMRNQIRLKYQIIVHVDYFKARHPKWDEYTAEQREKRIDEMCRAIDESLTDSTNAYRSIVSVFGTDAFGRETGKIEIIAIDDKTKKDDWVPSSTAADAQIVQTLGYSPTMMGLASERGGVGAGSGSDKREMYNILIGTNTIEQRIILEPLNWIARYNARANPDWDVVFFIDHTRHTSSNLREDGMDPSPDTIMPE